MCGRSSLHDVPTNILEHFSLPPVLPGFRDRFNISPSQDQWTLAIDRNNAPVVRARKWGLVPNWASDPSIGARMINARAESLADKPAWRESLETRRCLILADGYYEWSREGKTRRPWFFHLAGNRAFAMAGLWDRWSKRGDSLETCTIITTEAGPRAAGIHHRMPVLLTLDAASEWLDSRTTAARLIEMLKSYDDPDLERHEVSRYVNTPANDSPECIAPVSFL